MYTVGVKTSFASPGHKRPGEKSRLGLHFSFAVAVSGGTYPKTLNVNSCILSRIYYVMLRDAYAHAYVNVRMYTYTCTRSADKRARAHSRTQHGVVLPLAPCRGTSARLRMCSSRQGREEERVRGSQGAKSTNPQERDAKRVTLASF